MKRGFTLIELSIVLVIITLVVGGVLAGRDMIANSNRLKTISQITQVQTAVKAFKLKYNAIPGDFNRAVQLWGRNSAISVDTCSATTSWNNSSYELGTCNGDGNGVVYESWMRYESLAFWQHLSNAELIDGKYRGGRIAGSGGVIAEAGIHVPKTYLPGNDQLGGVPVIAVNHAVWSNGFAPLSSTDINNMLVQSNVLEIGNSNSSNGWISNGINPLDAYSLDSKLDDGSAIAGTMRSTPVGVCASPSTGAYYSAYTTSYVCTLIMPNAF